MIGEQLAKCDTCNMSWKYSVDDEIPNECPYCGSEYINA